MAGAAIHEAGHAVVGHVFGWDISEIRISGSDSGATVWTNSESLWWHWSQNIPRAKRALCVSVAGYVAECNPLSARLNDLPKVAPSEEDEFRAAITAFAVCRGRKLKDNLCYEMALHVGVSRGVDLSPPILK